MVHQNLLLFSLVGMLNTFTAADNEVKSTATLSVNSNLGKCQSCLTDIVGTDPLLLTSPPTHNRNQLSTTVQIHASGYAYSFIRAQLDFQSDHTCGFIPMAGLEPAKIVENTNIPAKMVESSQTLCVLTDVQTSFTCRICLKMTSGYHSMQNFSW